LEIILTPWSYVLLEKLLAVQEFSNNLRNLRIRNHVLKSPSTNPYPEPAQSSPFHTHLILCKKYVFLPSGSLLLGFPSKFNMHFCSPVRATCHANLILLDLAIILNYTCHRVRIMQGLIMQFSSTSYHLIPLRYKYPPQHPVLKHPQSMFLP
jgi:hypothetical protein